MIKNILYLTFNSCWVS